jgi:eukaryotic-like serine/threonine-protein kinase
VEPTEQAGDPLLDRALAILMQELAAGPRSSDQESAARSTQTLDRVDAALKAGGTPPTLGRYILLERLGAGGMGVVYAAFDPQLDRRVAIKLLTKDRDDGGVRLAREAQAMAKLSHPNVAGVYEVGSHADCVFLAMELVLGQTLRAWAHEARRTQKELLAVYLQAGRGLAAAHAVGLVHRDFKPDNAVLGTDDRVRVVDFGLARYGDAASSTNHELAPHDRRSALDTPLTLTGSTIGTPGYMAPEQLLGKAVDHRTDQFAFCVALHEALSGVRPFAGSTAADRLDGIAKGEIADGPRTSEIPRHVRTALARGLAADASRRWPGMDQLLAELARDPARARRRLIAVVAGGIAVVTVAGGFALDRTRRVRGCATEAARISDVWNADVRERVGAAILGTGLGNAEDTWQRLAPLLDDYAARWAETREQVCMSATVERTRSAVLQRLANECLDDARDALSARLALFVDPDATVLAQALASVHDLPALEPCTEDAELSQRTSRPEEPQQRELAAALSRQLVHNDVLAGTDRLVDGLARAQELAEQARRADLPELHAAALVQVGTFATALGDHVVARPALEQASTIALLSGADRLVIRAAIAMIGRGGSRAEFEQSLWWAWLARTLLDRAAADNPTLRLSLLRALDGAQRRLDDHAAREPLLTSALALAEQTYGPEHAAYGLVLQQIGVLRRDQGRHADAVVELDRALAILEPALGASHPAFGSVLTDKAIALIGLERYDEAAEVGKRAVAIQEAAFGPNHFRVAIALNSLANVHTLLGEYDEANAVRERALVATDGSPSDSARAIRGSVYQDRANTRMRRGLFAEAVPDYERALEIHQRAYGRESLPVARTLLSLAEVRRVMSDVEGSVPLYMRALAILEPNGDHPDLVKLLGGLAEAHLALGRVREAHEGNERVAQMCERLKCGPTNRAINAYALARSSAAGGADAAQVRAHIDDSRAWAEKAAADDRRMILAEIEMWAADNLR